MGYKAFFDEERSFGLEFEMYGVPVTLLQDRLEREGVACHYMGYTHQVVSHWKLVTDGSVRGSHGIELVSPVLRGVEGLNEVKKVLDICSEMGARVNTSTGFHVHWNVADFTGKNIMSLLRLYAKFEPVIDYFVSPSRRGNGNNYCMSMVKDHDLGWVYELDQTGRERASAASIVDQFDRWHRRNRSYSASGSRFHKVNVQSYRLYGTVEFRQHQGTVNSEKAIAWILLTQQLVNKSRYVSVSRKMSAKMTFGELMRTLRLQSHHVENGSCDPFLAGLQPYLKRRYTEFRKIEMGDYENA